MGEGDKGEWTGKVKIRTRKKFLAVGEACMDRSASTYGWGSVDVRLSARGC